MTEPEVRVGSGLSTLTLSKPEDAGVDSVVAPILTEWPAGIVDAGEYTPSAEIRPVKLVPPATPSTDHTTETALSPTEALYRALPPSLTVDGPATETSSEVCACMLPFRSAKTNIKQAIACWQARKKIGGLCCQIWGGILAWLRSLTKT